MSERFEEKLREALASHDQDGDAAAVAGLADGARARLRSRRRTTMTMVGAAVAVAAVPAVLAVMGPSRDAAPGPGGPTASESSADPTPDTDPAPAGQRVESWRNLTVLVPNDWGYGGGSDWCADGGLGQRPEVVRTDGAVRTIGCTPQNGYGVYFGDGSAIRFVYGSGHVWQYGWESPDQVHVYPEDAWLGFFQDGDHYLMVVTPDEATTRAVLESARVVRGHDPNGCAVRDGTDVAQGDGDRWSVCRYSGDGWLAQSELLTVEESRAFLDAVTAAPSGGAFPASCGNEADPGRVAAGSGGDLGSVSVHYEGSCLRSHGVTLSGRAAALTADVLYWALSPGWSGAVDGSVPLPDPLRR